MHSRIIGYDVARALAFFGMVFVNFRLVLTGHTQNPTGLGSILSLLDGRAAATFVVLAGVGLSLLSRNAVKTGDGLASVRTTLLKRALFLFVVGLIYTPIWPADILHFYGVYIAIGALLLTASDKTLWSAAAAAVLGFVLLLFLFDYEAGWNFETLSYRGFWTPQGMVRNLFFNGFHPVVPWLAFLLLGMWLGRQDVRQQGVKLKLFAGGTVVAGFAEICSQLLIRFSLSNAPAEDAEVIRAVFGTSPMPPTPFYMLAAGGTAVAAIAVCLFLTERFPESRLFKPLVSTGQLALTLYVAHVVIGFGTLEALGRMSHQSVEFAACSAGLFCVVAIIFSFIWRKRFERGPLESMMRQLTGPGERGQSWPR